MEAFVGVQGGHFDFGVGAAGLNGDHVTDGTVVITTVVVVSVCVSGRSVVVI